MVKLVELAGFVIVVNEVKMAGFVLVANVEEMMGSQAQVCVVKMMGFKIVKMSCFVVVINVYKNDRISSCSQLKSE